MITVVIPVLDEEESLEALHAEIAEVAQRNEYELQIIFVDDGSQDGSWAAIQALAAADSRVLGIRLRRNFGKSAALRAGFNEAVGDVVVTLDADLQDDPAEIPKLLAKMAEGFDVVSGWKQVRHDPWHKVLPSRLFNRLVRMATGVRLHDHNCGLKAYRREVTHEVRLYGELHRFIPVLAAARGFRVGEVVVHHRPRRFGHSKYGASRLVKGFLDLLTVKFLTGYGFRPQHLLGGFGLVAFLLGLVGLFYLASYWVLSRVVDSIAVIHLHETAALYYSLALFLIGAQFIAVGFLAELFTAHLTRDIDTFSIAEHTSPDRKPQEQQSYASDAS